MSKVKESVRVAGDRTSSIKQHISIQKNATFLMFAGDQCGRAEEAIKFYTSLFRQSEVKKIEYFKAGEPGGKEGTIKHALFSLAGQEYMAIDSALGHSFSFSPSISIYVSCENEEEINRLFKSLLEGGSAMMPLNAYGFSKRFGWVTDKYGISWQLNLKV
jgi:predicted 3-demethylubiquinone-9 3-methyltransferase (glyoxalase superfamily)